MRICLGACWLVALAWAAPVSAQATDFTITVPVNVSGVPPSVISMGIGCVIKPTQFGDASTYIARGNQLLHLTGGAYHGNVTIAVNALPGKDPAQAHWYFCIADFEGAGSTIYFQGGNMTPPVFPLVTGAPFYLGTTVPTRIPGR